MGRKKSLEPKKVTTTFKQYPKEKEEMIKKARKKYMSMSTYIKYCLSLNK